MVVESCVGQAIKIIRRLVGRCNWSSIGHGVGPLLRAISYNAIGLSNNIQKILLDYVNMECEFPKNHDGFLQL